MGSGAQIKTGAWDPEEDDLLYYWQSKVGNKWSEVAKHIPGRTGQQCAQRWRHKVNPNIRRDKWTADEDAKLIELVKTFGVGRWAEIARNCDGRTDQQCMGRWRRHLDPSIRRDSWSAEEDAKLRQLHAQYGTSWSRISKNLKGRTSQQCRARWHQINNSRSKSCGSGGTGALLAAVAGGSGGRQAAGRKGSAIKRKSSRRRQDSSCSEEEEDEEEEEELYDEDEEAADEQGGSSHAHSGSGSQQYEEEQQQGYAAAVAAAAAAAGFGYATAEMQQPWVASLAAGMLHGALSTASDSAAHAAAQQYSDADQPQQQQHVQSGIEDVGEEDEDDRDGDEDAPSHHDGRDGYRSSPLGRYKSMPSKLGGAAAAAAGRCLKHTGSLPVGRRAPSSSCLSPNPLWSAAGQQQQTWSPSRLLLSPQAPRGRAAARVDVSKDVNDAEAEGAETLLEMASLLQQESCELQPAQLPALPAYTPPKRPAGSRLDAEDLQDGLSPSPYKRARSSRLFADEEGVDADGYEPSSLGPRQQQRSRVASGCGEQLEENHPGPQPSPTAAAAAGGHPRRNGSSFRHYRVPHAKAAAAAAAAGEPSSVAFDASAAAAGAPNGPQESYGGGFLGDLGFRDHGLGIHLEQDGEAGRPSNASCLTGMRGQDAIAAAAAAAAAALMSPPRPMRGARAGAPGSATTTTPNRPTTHQNVMNLLGSPMFERMVGCATPPSAGRTQPSAATLAALQSPQPSRVPEPFWTPFTGLFQDALFTRGTSATPDLPSAGKPRLPRGLFSPANLRSGTGSGGKVVPRRGLLHGADSPMGPCAQDTDDDRLGSQPSGGSAEPPSLGGCGDAETGPSPAAACGVPPSGSQSAHRVVRRLDQHEAWGGSRASPSKQQGHPADATTTKHEGLSASGAGFSLFSPVKKQRVPLFSEASSIKVGATPSKPDAPGFDELLPIAPLKHTLPEQSCNCLQQSQQQGSPQDRLAAAAASSFLHGCSPLGAKSCGAMGHVGAAEPQQQLHTAFAQQQAGPHHQQHHQQAVGGAFRSAAQQLDLEQHQQQQEDPHGAAAGAGSQGSQQQHSADAGADEGQLVGGDGSPALERAGSINHRPMAYDEPDTPVNVADTADNTSCSGTPNTPAGMRADASGGAAGHLQSPNEYVTPPQHRLRASRPLAPLHKDCLIAAATRSLADGLAQQQQQRKQKQAASAAVSSGAAAGAAPAAAVSVAAGDDSPGQCTGDSSRVLSCERLMDSPLEATALANGSPGQWHQGMVAMLRGLQQTPLQPKNQAAVQQGLAGATTAAGGSPTTAAAGAGVSGSPAVGIKVCSRALRRLQDELERGSAATAAAAVALMAKQQQHVKQEQQQDGFHKDSDAEVPFSAGMSLAHATAGAGGAAASCSTPMMLPLFTVPSGSRLPGKGGPAGAGGSGGSAAAGVRCSSTPLAHAPQCSSGVASVSLTPAVVTLHTPSAAASAGMLSRMPAMAWPVQQRSDGGMVVSAPMTGTAAAAGSLVQLTPAASSTKAVPSTGATPFPAVVGGGPAAQQVSWPVASPLPVISIQPLTLLATACNAAVAAGQAAALQSVLALQPGTAPAAGGATAVLPEQLRSAGGSAAAGFRDSSHAVRSRLHALIDSV